MKKICGLILAFLFIFLISAQSTYAYNGGVLNQHEGWKSRNTSDIAALTPCSNSTLAITDNNEETFLGLTNSQDCGSVVFFTLQEVKELNSFILNTSSIADMRIAFWTTDKKLISYVDYKGSVESNEKQNFDKASGVKYVTVGYRGGGSGPNVYEFNVFATNYVPEPEPAENRAILVIEMVNGLEKEYDLPINDINAFLNWYDSRSAGTGSSRFGIDKYLNNKGPFTSRKDYVIFDKILTFSVDEYSTNK
ncbi:MULTISPECIES: hypothetical protein [Saccharibacillus]|uniref:hypothetical protein n=1 Tax=Saccharibacillus TaxID=456492 RepID=UPI00123A1B90|nr:hypothetical protein [Saccharibacillus sp. WB 17]MWJ31282.1 hypothetical protein [Saccharibacillus sp. WB 17]